MRFVKNNKNIIHGERLTWHTPTNTTKCKGTKKKQYKKSHARTNL